VIIIEPPFPDIPLPVPDPGFPFPSNDFFNIQLFSENDPLASTLEATIPIGEYQITLFDGWVLEKVVDGEAVSVEARLVGSSFQTFSIAANEETVVVYRFETNGEVIEFGQGRLIVRIEVEERENLGENARRGAIETSLGALTGFSLRNTLTTALENSGRTIGVIGTPVSESYPKENRDLQAEIARRFLVISQVPVTRYGQQIWKQNRLFFPERNVTMSALTQASVIIEASDTSGTLTQARAALKQGRKLFILDSCFENPDISWPTKFEEKGAIRVRDFEQIRDVLSAAAD